MTNANGSDFLLGQIGQISVPVTDIDRAIAFYRDVLGMDFLFYAPPGLGFFNCNGVRLMLDSPASERAGQGSVIYFKVEDLDAVFQVLTAREVNFETDPHLVARMPDHELWMAFLRDPDGNLLAMMSEVRH
ncbi:MAG: methylmalonyl-CoA/ethylmalonyl-CoA epimerase [Rhodothermales bacterium]|jgi:methylmalonyl-CoA/ethylmalonyl-CoA epimerase